MNIRDITRLVILAVSLLLAVPAHAFYNPANGNWTSRDPIGEKGGVNLYGMVGNDALNRVDHLGLKIVFRKPIYDFSDPKYGVNFEQWKKDYEEMKIQLEGDIQKLKKCCDKLPDKVGKLGICIAINDPNKEYYITIQPRDWHNKGAPAFQPDKKGGSINWPIPGKGPQVTQGHEVYTGPNADGAYTVSDQLNGTLLAHELEHYVTDQGKSGEQSSDPEKFSNAGEETATNAENQIRICCPDFKGPLRDSHNRPVKIER